MSTPAPTIVALIEIMRLSNVKGAVFFRLTGRRFRIATELETGLVSYSVLAIDVSICLKFLNGEIRIAEHAEQAGLVDTCQNCLGDVRNLVTGLATKYVEIFGGETFWLGVHQLLEKCADTDRKVLVLWVFEAFEFVWSES
jgi:hypothetical protein